MTDFGPFWDRRFPVITLERHGLCQCISNRRLHDDHPGKCIYTLVRLSDGHRFELDQPSLLQHAMNARGIEEVP